MVQPLPEHVEAVQPAPEAFEVERQDGEALGALPFEYIEGLVVSGCLRASDLVHRAPGGEATKLGAWGRLDRAFEAQQQRASVGASLGAFVTPQALMSALGLEPSTVRKIEASPGLPAPTRAAARAEPVTTTETNAEWVDFDPFADEAALTEAPPTTPPEAPRRARAEPAGPPLRVPEPGTTPKEVARRLKITDARSLSRGLAVGGLAMCGVVVGSITLPTALFGEIPPLSSGPSWALMLPLLLMGAAATLLALSPVMELDGRAGRAPSLVLFLTAGLGATMAGMLMAPLDASNGYSSFIARVGLAIAIEALLRGALDRILDQIPHPVPRGAVSAASVAALYTAALAPYLEQPALGLAIFTGLGAGLAALRIASRSASLTAFAHVVVGFSAFLFVA